MMDLRRRLMMGMTSGVYKKIYSTEITANVTSTTPVVITTLSLPASAYTSDKIVFVKIRDKSGRREGYLIGTDNIIINERPANGQASKLTALSRAVYKVDSNNKTTFIFDTYGIYVSALSANGSMDIFGRYGETRTGTINGTYTIDVYLLDWPNDESPFVQ